MSPAGVEAERGLRAAGPAEHPAVAALIARAFAEEPFADWVVAGGAAGRDARLRAFAGLAVALAAPHGGVLVDEHLTAGALVLPPGGERQAPLQALRGLPSLLRATGVRRLAPVLAGLARLERAHPADPHETILMLGVEPGMQDRGVGGALLRRLTARADRRDLAMYLETCSPLTRARAGRHGFAVHGELALPGGGPPVWTMLRPPG